MDSVIKYYTNAPQESLTWDITSNTNETPPISPEPWVRKKEQNQLGTIGRTYKIVERPFKDSVLLFTPPVQFDTATCTFDNGLFLGTVFVRVKEVRVSEYTIKSRDSAAYDKRVLMSEIKNNTSALSGVNFVSC